MTTWILIRHAQTKANEEGVLAGFLETPLNAIGKKQAKALSNYLQDQKIDYFYSSPSRRAYDTLMPLVKKQRGNASSIIQVEALREIHFGNFEGKGFKWIQEHYPEEVDKMLAEKAYYCYPEGESLIMAHQRIASWMDEISQQHTKEVIAVCAHAGTIRSMMSQFISGDHSLHWHFKIDNASVSIVTVEEGFAVIESLNNTASLRFKDSL